MLMNKLMTMMLLAAVQAMPVIIVPEEPLHSNATNELDIVNRARDVLEHPTSLDPLPDPLHEEELEPIQLPPPQRQLTEEQDENNEEPKTPRHNRIGRFAIREELEHWSETYLELKSLKGHFDDQPFNDSVDAWESPKHISMIYLQEFLLIPGASVDLVRAFMGTPDHIGYPPDMAPEELDLGPMPKMAGELWIFKWRGFHDFVWVYAVPHGHVVSSGWYYDKSL